MKKTVLFYSMIILSALAGMIISALLVFEYYGISPLSAEAVCSKGSGINACTVVSSSRFAAVKGLPVIKEFPVAAGGVFFYGFITVFQIFSVFNIKKRNTINVN